MNPYINIKSIPKWPYLLLFALAFVFYGNSLKNGFSMDDDLVTSTPKFYHKNVSKGFDGIVPIFKSRYATNATQNYEYRPVTTVTFAIQYSFFANPQLEADARKNPNASESKNYWDNQAKISHYISIFLYILCCYLVYILAFKISPNYKLIVGICTAILFLIHPIHTEVVANIKCRDELLVMFFGFLSLLLFYKFAQDNSLSLKKNIVIVGFGVLFLILAIFSKQSALMFLGIIPLVLYFFSSIRIQSLGVLLLLLVGSSFVFFGAQHFMFDEPEIREVMFFENPLFFHTELSYRLPMFFYSIMWYLKMMFFPYPMGFYYGYNQIPLANFSMISVWIGLVFTVGLTLMSVFRLKKKEIWSFGFLFFMLAIGGVANLILIPPGIVADRFLLVPSFSLLFCASYYTAHWYHKTNASKTKKYALYSISSLILLLSLTVVTKRNNAWESKYTLYKTDIQHLSQSTKAHSLLAVEYKELAEINNTNFDTYLAYIDSSQYHFKRAIEIYPEYGSCLNNLAVLKHMYLKQTLQAIPLFKRAIQTKEKYHQAHHSLGSCYLKLANTSDYLNNVLQYINPDSLAQNKFINTLDSRLHNSATFAQSLAEIIPSIIQSKGQNIVNPTSQNAALQEIKALCSQFQILENDYLKNNFEFKKELIDPLEKTLPMFSNQNYEQTLETIIKGVHYKLGVFYADLLVNNLNIKTFEDAEQLFYIINDQRKIYLDSSLYYYKTAIEIEPNNAYYYDEYIAVLHKENKEDAFVAINNDAIQNAYLKNKSQYYFNLANYYTFKKNEKLALDYIEKGSMHTLNQLKTLKNDENQNDPHIQSQKKLLNASLKNLYLVAIQIHNNEGNLHEAEKYSQLYKSIK